MNNDQLILKTRDEKAIPHLEQYSPVWLISQTLLSDDESVRFHVAFQHRLYGWVNRQYYYDGFNNVLYHKGQTLLSDKEALEVQETTPWIANVTADVPNSYGG